MRGGITCCAFVLLLLSLVLFTSGCASRKPSAPASYSLVWPAAPVPPRLAFVQNITRPSDLHAKRPALSRFASWITGSERGNETLLKPFGIAVDEEQNLCITDTGANVVCFFERKTRKWRRWERIDKVEFSSPVAVAKRRGIFFVADSALGRIIAFDERGKFLFDITNRLERPAGLAASEDRLWVTDSQRHCVISYNLGGGFLSEFGRRGTGLGQFNFPTHIAVNNQGTLFVTDSMNGRIQVIDPSGTARTQIGSVGDTSGHFSRPKGVALDSFGHVYVVDALFDNIQVFDSSGQFLLYLGEAGTQAGQFWLPNGIAISRENEIFVADSYNRRVQVFRYIGQQ